jgi:excisionase family DNA binding protein
MNESKEARAYTVETLAEHLQCSRRAVYNLLKAGKIRPFKIGKRGLRIAPEEVERWQRESTESATGSEPADPWKIFVGRLHGGR